MPTLAYGRKIPVRKDIREEGGQEGRGGGMERDKDATSLREGRCDELAVPTVLVPTQ